MSSKRVVIGLLILFLFIISCSSENIIEQKDMNMGEAVPQGEKVEIQPVNPGDLRPGNIVAFRKENSSEIVISRIVMVDAGAGFFIAKGDVNQNPELWEMEVPIEYIMGLVLK